MGIFKKLICKIEGHDILLKVQPICDEVNNVVFLMKCKRCGMKLDFEHKVLKKDDKWGLEVVESYCETNMGRLYVEGKL